MIMGGLLVLLGMLIGGTPCFFLGFLLGKRPTRDNITISLKRTALRE